MAGLAGSQNSGPGELPLGIGPNGTERTGPSKGTRSLGTAVLRIDANFFQQDAVVCAESLIGSTFIWDGCGGTIVETEAYRAEGDPACHTFFRKSAKQFVDQHPAGTAYVYLNYGVHWLFNVLTKQDRNIGFVLLRAILPETGIPQMELRRNQTTLKNLCSGPGKLTQALGISGNVKKSLS